MLEAIDPEAVREVARKLVAAALGGDTHAMREVLNRGLGKPRPAPADPLGVDLGAVRSSGDLGPVVARVLDGLSRGVIDADQAQALMSTLSTGAHVLELSELEQRLSNLESALKGASEPTGPRKCPVPGEVAFPPPARVDAEPEDRPAELSPRERAEAEIVRELRQSADPILRDEAAFAEAVRLRLEALDEGEGAHPAGD